MDRNTSSLDRGKLASGEQCTSRGYIIPQLIEVNIYYIFSKENRISAALAICCGFQ